MSHSRKRLDLTGQRFGKLTVLAPAENIRKRTAWLCRCDCGQETVVTTARLRNGLRTSCGCDNDLYGKPPSEIGRASLTYVDGTCVEMIRAGTVRCNNTSGVPGVNWVARKQRWQASICFKGTATTWAAIRSSAKPSRPGSGRRRSCTCPSWSSSKSPKKNDPLPAL